MVDVPKKTVSSTKKVRNRPTKGKYNGDQKASVTSHTFSITPTSAQSHSSLNKHANASLHHKEYTQLDLISNAVYIYVVLLFSFIVIGIIIYAFREYMLSIRNRTKSATSEKIANANWSDGDNGGDQKEADQDKNDEKDDCADLEKEGSFNRRVSDNKSLNSIAPSIPFIRLRKVSQQSNLSPFQETDSDLIKEIDDIKKIQVIYDEINTGETQSITKYLIESHKPNLSKISYSFKQLDEIKEKIITEQQARLHLNNTMVKMSEILQFLVEIPTAPKQSTFQNNKSINEINYSLIELKLLDLSSKSIMILRLVSLGMNQDNQNYFLHSFNETIEFITDTGIIFELIESINNETLKVLFIEMILNYCWQHWNFKDDNNTSTLSIQSRITIFRILCNLKLGLSTVENFSPQIRNLVEFKVQALFRELTKRVQCNDYLEMIPMISQAIAMSDMKSLKYLFYDLLFLIIKSHGTCCMNDYLRDKQTDLKVVIQHGFWYKHDKKIIDKTNEIFKHLVQLEQNIHSWYSEVSEGKIFVSSAVNGSSYDKQEPISNRTSGVVTPGSWK